MSLILNQPPPLSKPATEQTQQPAPEASQQATQQPAPELEAAESTFDFAERLKGAAPPPQSVGGAAVESERIDYSGGAIAAPEPAYSEEMSEADATKNAKIFMDIREGVQSALFAFVGDGTLSNAGMYNYTPAQKQALVEAWAPLLKHYKINVSPWLNVVFQEGINTTPHLVLMMQNKKYRKQAAMYKEKYEQERARNNAPIINVSDTERNFDNNDAWKIDDNKFWMYGPKGSPYIKKDDRKIKAEPKKEYLAKLVEVNGKEKIESIFDIKI